MSSLAVASIIEKIRKKHLSSINWKRPGFIHAEYILYHIKQYISQEQAGRVSSLYWFIYSKSYSFMIFGTSVWCVVCEDEAPVGFIHTGGCNKWDWAVTSGDGWRNVKGGDMPGPWLWLTGNINTVPLDCHSVLIYLQSGKKVPGEGKKDRDRAGVDKSRVGQREEK